MSGGGALGLVCLGMFSFGSRCLQELFLVGMTAQDFHLASLNIVKRSHDTDLSLQSEFSQFGTSHEQVTQRLPDVLHDRHAHDLIIAGSGMFRTCGFFSRVDVVEKMRERTVDLRIANTGCDCAAFCMTHDHEHGCIEVAATILRCRGNVFVNDVARDPDDEEISDSAIKNNLRWLAGIRTGKDRCQGMLAFRGGRGAAPAVCIGVLVLTLHETGISLG